MQYCGIILTGPKGAGKTEIANQLVANSDFQIVQAITTRERRPNGDEYYDIVTDAARIPYPSSVLINIFPDSVFIKYSK